MNIIEQKEKFDIAKVKAMLASSQTYQSIKNYEIEKILELSSTNIEPLELKGMLKLVAWVDGWNKEFERLNKEIQQQK